MCQKLSKTNGQEEEENLAWNREKEQEDGGYSAVRKRTRNYKGMR